MSPAPLPPPSAVPPPRYRGAGELLIERPVAQPRQIEAFDLAEQFDERLGAALQRRVALRRARQRRAARAGAAIKEAA